mmetsp:Transcript_8542/g.35618  ORF Transcript_8542/g.35618 Transcript_8542/m.35618 type:complete len:257 (-) Transcript_8542:703-1473(-)
MNCTFGLQEGRRLARVPYAVVDAHSAEAVAHCKEPALPKRRRHRIPRLLYPGAVANDVLRNGVPVDRRVDERRRPLQAQVLLDSIDGDGSHLLLCHAGHVRRRVVDALCAAEHGSEAEVAVLLATLECKAVEDDAQEPLLHPGRHQVPEAALDAVQLAVELHVHHCDVAKVHLRQLRVRLGAALLQQARQSMGRQGAEHVRGIQLPTARQLHSNALLVRLCCQGAHESARHKGEPVSVRPLHVGQHAVRECLQPTG